MKIKTMLKPHVRFLFVLFVIAAIAVLGVMFSRRNDAQEKQPATNRAKFARFAEADAITAAIRDGNNEIVRVRYRSIEDLEKASRFGQVIENYGSFAILVKKKGTNLSRSGLEVERIETTINVPGGKFEPLAEPPSGTLQTGENAVQPERGYYVVQFGGTVTDEWLESVRDAGIEVLQYVPHQAFFVHGESDAIARVAAHSRVRWAGKYNSEQKLSPEVKAFANAAKGSTAMFDVAVFDRADLELAATEIVRVTGGRIISKQDLPHNFFNIVRIEAAPSSLGSIAEIADVFRVDQYERPQKEDERAAQIISGNYSSATVLSPPGYDPLTQFGVDGTGVTIGMVDDGVSIPGNGGFYLTSANTVNGPLRGATAGAEGGHGHLNASIIAGSTPFGILDPTGYNYGRGIAPKANIINIPFLKAGNTTSDAQSVDDTLTTLGPNGVKGTITNNSWGSGTNGNSYDALAATYDGFVFDASAAATIDPFTIIFSAGNSGPTANSLTRPKVSKNTIAVANSENIRTEFSATNADNMEDLRSSSSRGPTADGRIKPDVTAPGSYITGSRAGTCGSVTSCFDANHAYSIGTSHAAPQVAGAAALFTQYWKNTHSGQYPFPSLIKAAIINSAQEMNGNITNTSTIPNGNEGWGRIYMKNMFSTTVPIYRDNQTTSLFAPGAARIYTFYVSDFTKPVRLTLVWTDPPGVSDPALVNNLDLTVTINGNTYRGNVFSGGISVTGGSSSTIDNVENVFLPAGISVGTQVTVRVAATALNGDGIPGNSDTTDQTYALVGYNTSTSPVTSIKSPVDFDGDSKTDISIFRPSVGQWWYLKSSNGGNAALAFGSATDKLVPADYTGDGKADITFWRPSTGEWFILRSEDNSFLSFPFGASGDVPVQGDYDGDGKADPVIFRPSTREWFILRSSGGTTITTFGAPGDVPVTGDFEGDGLTDIAIYRPSAGEWWIRRSSNASVYAFAFGTATDKPVQGDYTGDGKADPAFFRPASGQWFILRSEDSSFYSVPFGTVGDAPSPGDYDGDGKFDTAVFRPSTATWYVQRSTAGTLITTFGTTGDVSVPNAFVP